MMPSTINRIIADTNDVPSGEHLNLLRDMLPALRLRYSALTMSRRKPTADLTARGTPRKNIPIRDLIVDLLRASGNVGLTNDDICKLLFESTADQYRRRVKQTMHMLRGEGRVQSWHPPVRHTLIR